MRKLALAVLIVMIAATALALAGGTRSLSDVKGPIFAAGALAAGLLVVLAALTGRDGCFRSWGLLFPFAALTWLAFTALSPLWAAHAWVGPYVLANRFLFVLLAGSAACAAAGARGWRALAWTYAALGAAVALFSLAWHGLYAHNLNDVRAPLGNANLLGALLILPIAFTAALGLREWRASRRAKVLLPLAAFAVLSISVLILCRSLSAWLGLVTAAGVFLALTARRRARAAVTLALIAAAGLSALYFSGALGRLESSRTYILRLEYWRRAAVMARERPVLGWGAGNFYTDNQPFGVGAALNEVTFDDGSGTRQVPLYVVLGNHHTSGAHNAYLDEAAEGGAVGLALFALLLAAPLVRGFSAKRAGFAEPVLLDAALAAYVAFLAIIGVTMNLRFADFAPHFWVLAGLLISSGWQGTTARAPWRGSAGRVLGVALAVAAAVWGIYEFAFRDFQSSMEYKTGLTVLQAGHRDEAVRELAAAGKHTWDPLLRVWSLDLRAKAYLSSGDDYLQSAYQVLKKLGGMVEGYNHYLLGVTFERSGDYRQALEAYRAHALYRPAEPNIGSRIMFAEAMLALDVGGENAWQAGLAYFRRHPGDRYHRHICFRRLLEEGEAALGALRELAGGFEIETSPTERYLSGRLRFLEGKHREAVELMEGAFAEGCRASGINHYRTLAYIELGETGKAREVIALGRKLNPTCKNLIELEKRLNPAAGADETGGADGQP